MSRQNTREQEALVGDRAGQGLLVWAVVGCWLALAVLILLVRQFPADYYYHLRLGQLVWEEHRIPTRDIFSYTAAGYPAYPHEWLADVAMYLLNSKSHLLLFVLLKLVAPLVALALVAWQSYKRCGSWVAVTAAGLVALLLLRSHADVRPLTLSWILIALFYWVLMGGEKPSRWLWVLPPLALLWANLHGSAPMGLALVRAGFPGCPLAIQSGSPPERRSCCSVFIWVEATCFGRLCDCGLPFDKSPGARHLAVSTQDIRQPGGDGFYPGVAIAKFPRCGYPAFTGRPFTHTSDFRLRAQKAPGVSACAVAPGNGA